MKPIKKALTLGAGAVVFALALYMILALPVLLFDRDGMAANGKQEAGR